MSKEKVIDRLLGELSLEKKIAQMMALGITGTFVDPEMWHFIDEFGIGGLRLSPTLARKFVRYLPPGAPGIENVERPPSFMEKVYDNDILPPHYTAREYAELINKIRERALRNNPELPIHTIIDCESGGGSNFVPRGLITTPTAMGFGHLGDLELLKQCSKILGQQLKAVGIDMIHSPVVDVNTNPNNPEIYTRSFSEDHRVVTACARVMLEGLREADMIGCMKHYPGRGPSGEDAHFGLSQIVLEREQMYREHLEPYSTLCAEGVVPAVMPAHSVYPTLDPSNEIATVSKPIITGILREEFGFNGVITTDSMTMGGLMAKYSVGEAALLAIEAGVDVLLLKDDNVLRWEMHRTIVDAVKSGRISVERIDQSLRRIWSMKWDYKLFDNHGIVDVEKIPDVLENPKFSELGRTAARKVIRLERDRANLLPLKPDRKILLVDRVTSSQLAVNDCWNHPAMLWEFMLEKAPDVAYVDYTDKTMDRAKELIGKLASQADIMVVTGDFCRGENNLDKNFIASLREFGKPIVLISSNPYEELLIPPEIDTVIVTYGLMRDSLEAVTDYLFQG